MDHLPLPEPPHITHIEVPVYKDATHKYEFDGGHWLEYPERCQFPKGNFYSLVFEDPGPDFRAKFASFVQAWLFYGVIADFLDFELDLDEWTRRTDHGTVVCTGPLPRYLDRWLHKVTSISEAERQRCHLRTTLVLNEARHFFSIATVSSFRFLESEWSSDRLPDELCLSIQILLATLTVAHNQAFADAQISHRRDPHLHLLHDQFIAHGWCPSDIEYLRQDTTILGEYYASRLGPLPRPLEHTQCAKDVCSACQINPKLYKTRHVYDKCNCEHVSADVGRLLEFLDKACIPAMYFMPKSNGVDAKVDCRAADSRDVPYVALSHVWADGLGNPFKNSLPLCQLDRLQHAVNNLDNHGKPNIEGYRFWIDTLCVPVGQSLRHYRDLAIMGLVSYYQKAEKILILSPELSHIPADRNHTELAMRIGRISWFRRLWTLQEGVIGNDLHFQMRDRSVHVQDLLSVTHDEYQGDFARLITKKIHEEAVSRILKLLQFKQIHPKDRISHVWQAVQWRTTSLKADETICLSNMLDLDLAPLLQINRDAAYAAEERMKIFIRQQVKFPTSSLFESYAGNTTDVATMSASGYRWAPKSFTFRTTKGRKIQHSPQLGRASQEGLWCELAGVRMQWSDLDIGKQHLVFTVPGDWDHWYQLSEPPSRRCSWSTANRNNGYMPAIVLERDLFDAGSEDNAALMSTRSFTAEAYPEEELTELVWKQNTFFANCIGIFVTIRCERDGVLMSDYHAPVHVAKLRYFTSKEPAWTQMDGLGQPRESSEVQSFDRVGSKQKWCIG